MITLQAYFQTEDEAKHVKALLGKLDATKLKIAQLEDKGSNEHLPLAVLDNTGLLQAQREEKFNIYRSFLSGEVTTEHYEEAVRLIESNKGQFDALIT